MKNAEEKTSKLPEVEVREEDKAQIHEYLQKEKGIKKEDFSYNFFFELINGLIIFSGLYSSSKQDKFHHLAFVFWTTAPTGYTRYWKLMDGVGIPSESLKLKDLLEENGKFYFKLAGKKFEILLSDFI
jgi:hypothetical protein